MVIKKDNKVADPLSSMYGHILLEEAIFKCYLNLEVVGFFDFFWYAFLTQIVDFDSLFIYIISVIHIPSPIYIYQEMRMGVEERGLKCKGWWIYGK